MDIDSRNDYPSCELSNLARHFFTIDGVQCASMEGFLQSLKFEESCIQIEICMLYGVTAKKKGREKEKEWKSTQTLWWRGIPIDRLGSEYKKLLDRAYLALSKNLDFRLALMKTKGKTLTHNVGLIDPEETCLTQDEFCGRLNTLRKRIA